MKEIALAVGGLWHEHSHDYGEYWSIKHEKDIFYNVCTVGNIAVQCKY